MQSQAKISEVLRKLCESAEREGDGAVCKLFNLRTGSKRPVIITGKLVPDLWPQRLLISITLVLSDIYAPGKY
jgi:hypothetical protein